jgi:predicted CopG family antitoxin
MAIYIKDDSYERLITAKDIVSDALLNMSALKGITIFFDFDPVNGY